MTDDELKVVDMMEELGGHFVKALAGCFRAADATNFLILKGTFCEYWFNYEMLVRQTEQREVVQKNSGVAQPGSARAP